MSRDLDATDTASQALSRRELIKALSALGGAAAVSSLMPSKWAPPELVSGVLPVHAQSTFTCLPPYVLINCLVNNVAWIDAGEGYDLGFSMYAQVRDPCPDVPVWYRHTIRFASGRETTTTMQAALTDIVGRLVLNIKRADVTGAVEVTAHFKIHAPFGDSECSDSADVPPYPSV